jgi:NCS1 family nucleobase:cation symporter-1
MCVPSISGTLTLMTAATTPAVPTERVRSLGVETTGIEIIDESERTASPKSTSSGRGSRRTSRSSASRMPRSCSASASPSGRRALVTVLGIVISFLLCGIIAIAGKRGIRADDDLVAGRRLA